jgi:hypothetical protein
MKNRASFLACASFLTDTVVESLQGFLVESVFYNPLAILVNISSTRK